jgi:hypothetical protein
LEGFEEISAAICALFSARPVIGFRDGWMIFASNVQAAEKVLDTRSGKAPAIDSTEQFRKFELDIEGPVYAISYQDLAAQTRQAAQFFRQAGAVVPLVVAMAGGKADADEMEPVQEIVALLPSVAKVIDKSDYFEARLSVVQAADSPGAYVKQAVTLVRPPEN